MANEIRVSANMLVSRDGDSVPLNGSVTTSMTGSKRIYNTQVIGTSYESLYIGDLGSIRYAMVKNISTASISVAMASTSSSFATMENEDDFILLSNSGSFTGYQLKASLANAEVATLVVER